MELLQQAMRGGVVMMGMQCNASTMTCTKAHVTVSPCVSAVEATFYQVRGWHFRQ